MSLLNKLISGQASATSLNGSTPIGNPNANAVTPLNGVLPQPSNLESPTAPTRYLDNLPT